MMYNRRTGTNKETVDRAEKSFVSLKHGSLCTAPHPLPLRKKRRRAPHVLLKVMGMSHFFRVTVEVKCYLSVLNYFFHSLEF